MSHYNLLTHCQSVSRAGVPNLRSPDPSGESLCSAGLPCRLNKNDQTDDHKPVKTLSEQFQRFTNSLARTSEITDRIHRVFGREGETVEVFIPLKGSPVAIYCLTPELSQKTISNPLTFWWREGISQAHVTGEEGDQYRVRLDGSLMLLNWESSKATGFYYCTTKYIYDQKEQSLKLRFCLVVQSQSEDAIIPCKTGQECHNDETLREAYQKIHTFITQSKSVMEASNNVPPLYYVQGSFKAMKVDHCLAGMGKLLGKNKPCMDCCAPKKERQTFSSTHLLITIIVCSLTFLGITVLTMYCLVAALRKEVTINQSPLRVKENANLKSMKYSPRHLTMTENQLKPFPCNLSMEADQNWGRGSYNEDGKQHLARET